MGVNAFDPMSAHLSFTEFKTNCLLYDDSNFIGLNQINSSFIFVPHYASCLFCFRIKIVKYLLINLYDINIFIVAWHLNLTFFLLYNRLQCNKIDFTNQNRLILYYFGFIVHSKPIYFNDFHLRYRYVCCFSYTCDQSIAKK